MAVESVCPHGPLYSQRALLSLHLEPRSPNDLASRLIWNLGSLTTVSGFSRVGKGEHAIHFHLGRYSSRGAAVEAKTVKRLQTHCRPPTERSHWSGFMNWLGMSGLQYRTKTVRPTNRPDTRLVPQTSPGKHRDQNVRVWVSLEPQRMGTCSSPLMHQKPEMGTVPLDGSHPFDALNRWELFPKSESQTFPREYPFTRLDIPGPGKCFSRRQN